MIRVVHPGSGFLTIPDPGVKKAPDPVSGSATLGARIWVVDQLRYSVTSNVVDPILDSQ